MAHSLFGILHRRFGRQLTGDERVRFTEERYAAINRDLPLNFLRVPASFTVGQELRVIVIGGGFAGLMAALSLHDVGCQVQLYEARDVLGGRVLTNRGGLLPGRLLEEGAELIGSNHPTWIEAARRFGLGLSVMTQEDHYRAAGLEVRVELLGRILSTTELRQLHHDMGAALANLTSLAAVVTDPYRPWKASGAPALDARTVDSWITSAAASNPLLEQALRKQFGGDYVAPTTQQSLLGLMAQIIGGGGQRFWEETEVFRCEDGNDALAQRMKSAMTRGASGASVQTSTPVVELWIRPDRVTVRTVGRNPGTADADFAILATPPSSWSHMAIHDETTRTSLSLPRVQIGPAAKYLAGTDTRYWIPQGAAPSGLSERIGEIWEGTDNQQGGTNIDLTVFSGGPFVIPSTTNPHTYYRPVINHLWPGLPTSPPRTYRNWTTEQFIEGGYASYAPRQVTTIGPVYHAPVSRRLILAGEHTILPFVGFMEGALQSGLFAMASTLTAAGRTLPSSLGGTRAIGP